MQILASQKKAETPSEPLQPKSLYIGIDQSYTGFGLVVLDENGHCHERSLLKFPSVGSDGGRLLHIQDTLIERLSIHLNSGAECTMAMEGYAYGAKLNREKLGELGGTVKLTWYALTGEDPLIIAPTTLKQFATGKGRASKEEMIFAVQKWDAEVTNHNVADAYALAYMLYSM